MARDVFPRRQDRALIRAFLTRHAVTTPGSDPALFSDPEAEIGWRGDTLTVNSRAVLWYDSAGALTFILPTDGRPELYRTILVVNAACSLLGIDARLDRQAEPYTDTSQPRSYVWVFNGAAIDPVKPVTVAGPLSMLAWRRGQSTE